MTLLQSDGGINKVEKESCSLVIFTWSDANFVIIIVIHMDKLDILHLLNPFITVMSFEYDC